MIILDMMTLEEAKQHVKITANHSDDDIIRKISQASSIMWNYLKIDLEASPIVFPWSADDIPFEVVAAASLVLGALLNDREGDKPILTQAAKDLVWRWRDPAMA